MRKKIKVQLTDGWSDYSKENPDGPSLFLRDDSESPAPLQVSLTEYVAGEIPNPSEHDLVKLSEKTGNERDFGDLIETNSGDCAMGKYGTAIFKSNEYPRMQVWYLSNGRVLSWLHTLGRMIQKKLLRLKKLCRT